MTINIQEFFKYDMDKTNQRKVKVAIAASPNKSRLSPRNPPVNSTADSTPNPLVNSTADSTPNPHVNSTTADSTPEEVQLYETLTAECKRENATRELRNKEKIEKVKQENKDKFNRHYRNFCNSLGLDPNARDMKSKMHTIFELLSTGKIQEAHEVIRSISGLENIGEDALRKFSELNQIGIDLEADYEKRAKQILNKSRQEFLDKYLNKILGASDKALEALDLPRSTNEDLETRCRENVDTLDAHKYSQTNPHRALFQARGIISENNRDYFSA